MPAELFNTLLTLEPSIQVLLGAALGIYSPSSFDWFHSGYFTTSLGFLMLSMGLTLTFKDFQDVSGPHTRP